MVQAKSISAGSMPAECWQKVVCFYGFLLTQAADVQLFVFSKKMAVFYLQALLIYTIVGQAV
jgi:hypothetical protein